MSRKAASLCPNPQPEYDGGNTLERRWRHALAYVSKLWRPSNSQEVTHCTVSRYAMHLIDLTTGIAYTVQQLLGSGSVSVMERTTEEGSDRKSVV